MRYAYDEMNSNRDGAELVYLSSSGLSLVGHVQNNAYVHIKYI